MLMQYVGLRLLHFDVLAGTRERAKKMNVSPVMAEPLVVACTGRGGLHVTRLGPCHRGRGRGRGRHMFDRR